MASGLRIVFFGTPEFAAYILRRLAESGEDIAAVVTTPDRAKGRGLKLQSSAVKLAAVELGIPVLEPEGLKDEGFQDRLRELKADVFAVVAFKILPRSVYTIPSHGSFNIHASLLPKYRGAAPINWAIIRGETKTGITSFLLEDKVDTGNMLVQKSLPIGPYESAGELHDRLMVLGADVAKETLSLLASGNVQPLKQDATLATSAPKLFPPDCAIELDRSAAELHNFIRGLSPYPGATLKLPDGSRAKILQAVPSHEASPPTGTWSVSNDNRKLFVGTGDGALEILTLQREGRGAVSADAFLRGNRQLIS